MSSHSSSSTPDHVRARERCQPPRLLSLPQIWNQPFLQRSFQNQLNWIFLEHCGASEGQLSARRVPVVAWSSWQGFIKLSSPRSYGLIICSKNNHIYLCTLCSSSSPCPYFLKLKLRQHTHTYHYMEGKLQAILLEE